MEESFWGAPVELVRPDYVIYNFVDGLYKIVKFNSTACAVRLSDKEGHNNYDEKLDASLSRARRSVLEYALCNEWKYFCTFTIAKDKYDRSDLAGWHKRFTQWLRDQRKKYKKLGHDLNFQFLLVPEPHEKDNAWHMHGLFSDISPLLVNFCDLAAAGVKLPSKLLTGDYFNWKDYQDKFGFCSFGLIKDSVAVSYYITKYITKSLQGSCIDVGLHLYYYSRGLKRPVKHGEVYGGCTALDQHLNNFYDFCATGMVTVKDPSAWSFGLEYMDVEIMEAFGDVPEEDPAVDKYISCVQQVLDGF